MIPFTAVGKVGQRLRSVAFGIQERVMRERIALLFTVLSLSVCVCAQEGTFEHYWTAKTNTEMYASYLVERWLTWFQTEGDIRCTAMQVAHP
jgi:hypothetical protein